MKATDYFKHKVENGEMTSEEALNPNSSNNFKHSTNDK